MMKNRLEIGIFMVRADFTVIYRCVVVVLI